jgi:hypothetical protein
MHFLSYLLLVCLFRYDMIVVALHDVCFQTEEEETGHACVKCYLRADKIQVRGIENKHHSHDIIKKNTVNTYIEIEKQTVYTSNHRNYLLKYRHIENLNTNSGDKRN